MSIAYTRAMVRRHPRRLVGEGGDALTPFRYPCTPVLPRRARRRPFIRNTWADPMHTTEAARMSAKGFRTASLSSRTR